MTTHADPRRNPKRGCPRGVASPLLKGSPAVRQREAHAVDLRTEGLTYREIGTRLGVTRQMATKIIMRALKALPRESAAQMVVLEGERLDAILAAMWPRAMAGSARHAMVALRVCERRARMFGLDAPARVEAHITREEHDAIDREIEALLAEYGGGEGGPVSDP
jgi:hypothetical protein